MPAFNPLTLKLQELQRRQALADAMQQQALEPNRGQVSGTPSYPIYVKPSPWESVAKVAQAAGAGFMNRQNDKRYGDIADQMMKAQADSLKALSGESDYPSAPTATQPGSSGAMPSPGTPSSAGVPPISNLPPPMITNPGYTPPPAAPPMPPPASAVPRGLGGPSLGQTLSAAQNAISYGVDPSVVQIAAQARAPTPEQRNIMAVYGNGPEGRSALERVVNPAVATNANAPLARFNPATGQYETAYAPPNMEKGTVPIVENGQITGVRALPGATETAAAHEAGITAATEAQKGRWVDDPVHPGQGHFAFPTPPAYRGGINDLGAIGRPPGPMPGVPNAADLEGMKVGAKTGQDYSADITAKAADAMAGKRNLAEMDNLLQGFTPGAFAPVLTKLGAAAQAMGADPATIQKLTSINPGDAEAFQKGTAALAGEAAKQVTNRVTQTEFKVFLANNPNWMMTPNGIKRVMDFMNKGFDNQIDMQQQFAQWSKGSSPDRWGIDFPAEYNKRQLALIKSGGMNSVPASIAPTQTSTDIRQSPGAAVTIHTKADFDKLPRGTKFTGADGITYRKP